MVIVEGVRLRTRASGRSRGGLWSISLQGREPRPPRPVRLHAERLLDILVAGGVLILTLPLLLGIALAVRLESRGPVFHRCLRSGRHRRSLYLLKFRKMHHGASGCPLTRSDDVRFTRIGAYLARTHLDELPQFWHVLNGSMALFGPRPEDPRFVAEYEAPYGELLTVPPGLCGWTQLVFADERALLDTADPVRTYLESVLPAKLALDLHYVRAHRFADVLLLLLWTPLVLSGLATVTYDPHRSTFRLRFRRSRAGLHRQMSPGGGRARSRSHDGQEDT